MAGKPPTSRPSGRVWRLLKSSATFVLGVIVGSILSPYIQDYFFKALPGPKVEGWIRLALRQPESPCDVYEFGLIFSGDYEVEKVSLLAEFPGPILQYRVGTSPRTTGQIDYAGVFMAHTGLNICEFTAEQENLPPNVKISNPFRDEFAIQAADLQNPIGGAFMLNRAPDPSSRHKIFTQGFYEYRIHGNLVHKPLSIKVISEANQQMP